MVCFVVYGSRINDISCKLADRGGFEQFMKFSVYASILMEEIISIPPKIPPVKSLCPFPVHEKTGRINSKGQELWLLLNKLQAFGC